MKWRITKGTHFISSSNQVSLRNYANGPRRYIKDPYNTSCVLCFCSRWEASVLKSRYIFRTSPTLFESLSWYIINHHGFTHLLSSGILISTYMNLDRWRHLTSCSWRYTKCCSYKALYCHGLEHFYVLNKWTSISVQRVTKDCNLIR